MLPNFLIVGAFKSGTTSLYEYLRPHPEIFMATPKELNYFSFDRRWAWGPTWYERHFKGASGAPAIGEASPSYTQVLRRETALERIAATLPGIRMIFLARHPIARARSSYIHVVSEGREHRPIDQVLVEHSEFVDQGLYGRTVDDLLGIVDRDRLLVLRSEHLRLDARATLARVHRFLGVEPIDSPVLGKQFNRAEDRPPVKRRTVRAISEVRPLVRLGEALPAWSKPALHRLTRREPAEVDAEIDAAVGARLIDYLRDDIRAFGRFLGEDLSAWEQWPPPDGMA